MDELLKKWMESHPDVEIYGYENVFKGEFNIQMFTKEDRRIKITRNILLSDIEVSLLSVLTDMYNQLKRDYNSYHEL